MSNDLSVASTPTALSNWLGQAHHALQQAKDDFERIDIRDHARKVQGIAAILERKEIAVIASHLVADAERAIAKANPPMSKKEVAILGGSATKKKHQHITNSTALLNCVPKEEPTPAKEIHPISKKSIESIRNAHNHLSDEQYEQIKTESTEKGEPLSRKALQRLKKKTNKEKRENLIKNPIPIPDGKYACIVIDPPWPIQKIQRYVAPEQVDMDYPTMTVEEIQAVPVPTLLADDAFVFLWTTQKYLPHSFDILSGWGLKYRWTMTWHKNGGFQPYNCPQFDTEFVVVGAKGNPQLASQKQFFTSFEAKREGHSIKPQKFYDTLLRVTYPPRIDMFNRREITGFDTWGNESK